MPWRRLVQPIRPNQYQPGRTFQRSARGGAAVDVALQIGAGERQHDGAVGMALTKLCYGRYTFAGVQEVGVLAAEFAANFDFAAQRAQDARPALNGDAVPFARAFGGGSGN